MSIFKPAEQTVNLLRFAIAGPSGSGKTWTALAVATNLIPDARVALLDTEHGSAAKYARDFDFDTVAMRAPFHPDRYAKAIESAQNEGYDVLIIDSISHAWGGPGGLLEIVDKLSAKSRSNNKFAAWGEATPIQNRLIDSMLRSPMHIIATARTKTEYVVEENDRGKKVPRKVGMAPVQRDGFEYEFDVFGEMDLDHRIVFSKTRCSELTGVVIEKPGAELAEILRAWLLGESFSPAEIEERLYAIASTGRMEFEQSDARDERVERRRAANANALRLYARTSKHKRSERETEPETKAPVAATDQPRARRSAPETASPATERRENGNGGLFPEDPVPQVDDEPGKEDEGVSRQEALALMGEQLELCGVSESKTIRKILWLITGKKIAKRTAMTRDQAVLVTETLSYIMNKLPTKMQRRDFLMFSAAFDEKLHDRKAIDTAYRIYSEEAPSS